ncbi:MAG: Delta-aminolevulinic acid dehydratase [Acidobacteria bacterium]|nr:Delta-aminolevulinic acid dehydratase [Acidobacteriota bacterium]
MSELIHRPRRLRRTAALREMTRETRLDPANLIYPLFVCAGEGVRREIKSMPGVFNLSIDELVKECEGARRGGVSSIIIFGLPESKDEKGSGAFAEDGITQRAIRAVKREVKDLIVIADTCLCEYTSHGHCGVIEDGDVANDPTLEILARTAVSQAESGADIIAPSGMMDGMIAAIRAGLDAAGFTHIPILSYAVKYASAFYGPFREAADSAPQFGDRRSYQMDPPNVREALREAELDVEQGADMLMVKPALPYLDVIRAVRERFDLPLAAYQVSGEYAQIKAAGRLGWIDEERVMMESLIAIKRAGADLILTYFARDVINRL